MAPRSITCYADPKKRYTVDVAEAFAAGCGGSVALDFVYRGGTSVVVGMGDGQHSVIQQSEDWMEIDHAYFGRGQYFRVSHNALWSSGNKEPDFNRLDRLGITIKPQQQIGKVILLALQSEGFYTRWANTNKVDFIRNVRQGVVAAKSRRTMMVRDKPIGRMKRKICPLEHHLSLSWIVIVHSSAVALDALACGLPVVVMDPTYAAARLATPLNQIEQPYRPSVEARRDLFARVAAAQWTMDEMRSGEAFERSYVNGSG